MQVLYELFIQMQLTNFCGQPRQTSAQMKKEAGETCLHREALAQIFSNQIRKMKKILTASDTNLKTDHIFNDEQV